MDKEFITLDNGLKIHYKEFGQGPTLLLIHGWNNDWSGFVPLIENVKEKFHVIAIDLPGYGKSDALKEEYSVEKLSDVVAEFIEKKNGEKIDILCALSMGTVIAADFAKKHSNRINSVVLIGPPIIKYDWKFSKLYRDWIKFMNKNIILMKSGHKIMSSGWYGHLTAKYINMHNYDRDLINMHGMRGRRSIDARALFQMGKAMYNYHLEKTLNEIKNPMLIILGRYDKVMNLSEAVRIGKTNNNVKVRWVEEAGHVVSLEKPKEVADLIKDFSKDLKIL